MRRSTFRTRVVTVCNKSRPCHKVLGNHLYIVSHNWTGEYHQTGQEQSLSVILQDNITQVPWHTHKPTHITHTHTHSVSHVLWHTSTQTNTLTHTNTHTQTRDWSCSYVLDTNTHTHTPSKKQPFMKIWTGQITQTHTMWVNLSDDLYVTVPSLYERRSSTRTRSTVHTTRPENQDMTTSHTYTLCEWISVMICT